MIYNLIETATGRNHSQSSTPIPDPKAGYHVVETADNVGVWNESTLVFDPYPPNRVISVGDFIDRFTPKEQEDLIEATKTIKKAATFVEVLKLKGIADLDSTFIQVAIVSMEGEPTNILAVGRAAEILA